MILLTLYIIQLFLDDLFEQRGSCDDILIVKQSCITDSYFANVVLGDGVSWLIFYDIIHTYGLVFSLKSRKTKLLKTSNEETLLNNYFLHFPGSWYERQMWKIKNILNGSTRNCS